MLSTLSLSRKRCVTCFFFFRYPSSVISLLLREIIDCFNNDKGPSSVIRRPFLKWNKMHLTVLYPSVLTRLCYLHENSVPFLFLVIINDKWRMTDVKKKYMKMFLFLSISTKKKCPFWPDVLKPIYMSLSKMSLFLCDKGPETKWPFSVYPLII